MKPMKGLKNSHTPNTKIGMGDYYGQGIKQKVGKMRSSSMDFSVPSPKKIKTPPKNIA